MNIFGITFIKMNEKEIATINSYEKQKNYKNKFIIPIHEPLPEFVIADGVIKRSEEFFQFMYDPDIIEDSDVNDYVLFDISLTDSFTTVEISECDGESFLNEIGFISAYNEWEDKLLIHDYNKQCTLLKEQLFIVEFKSWKTLTDYGYDYDYVIELIGFLNQEMQLEGGYEDVLEKM